MWSAEKCTHGWVNMSPYNFLYVDESSCNFFRPTWKGLWLLKYFSDLRYVDLFRRNSQTKVESCQKSRRMLDVFSPSQILGGGPSKSYTLFITPASQHVAGKKFCGDTPTSPEVIGAHTLNFKPNFNLIFLRLNFLGTPVPAGVCASKAWSICSTCKKLRGQHPLRAEI